MRRLAMKNVRQRDLDPAVAKAAPKVCDAILQRMREALPDCPTHETGFVLGHRFAWDRAKELVERFKAECS